MRPNLSSLVILAAMIGLLAVPQKAAAQTANIVTYNQQTFSPGVNTVTGTPIQTNSYQASGVVCGQVAPTVPASIVNPTRFFIDDAAVPGKVCIGALASVLLPALPNGVGYQSTFTQVDNLGQESPRSAASNPFGKQGTPAALTGLKIIGS